MQTEHMDIDIVMTWVDGNDPAWREERFRVRKKLGLVENREDDNARFRDWENLQYIFRGIEKFMPWVRKVHFVTWGHIPTWLNTECEKLHIVKHSDYIPEQYLPTFNSNTIELNYFRIEDLAEHFINFNDDMFIIKPIAITDYFRNGLPCDLSAISPQPIFRSNICNIELNNMEIINDHFTVQDIMKNKKKWLNPVLGQYAVRTALFTRFNSILGVFQPHVPWAHLKSTAEEVWGLEQEALHASCLNTFRSAGDLNEWLFRSWQMMSGKFEPRTPKFGIYTRAYEMDRVKDVLFHSPYKVCCINDTEDVTDFEGTKKIINGYLQVLLPEKSKFEL